MAAISGIFGGTSTASKKLCQFEIRLDEDFVVLRGTEDETAAFKILGRLVLMNSETVQTKGIHVGLEGKRRTMKILFSEKDRQNGLSTKAPIVNKSTILNKSLNILSDGKSVKPGNYEWPFEFELEGNTPESIEGMPGNFITYGIKATVDRGLLAKDLVARKHVRIIRTLGHDSTLLVDPQEVSGFWPDKIKYQFSTKSRAAIFGDRLITDIELTPLIDKLQIGKVTVSLKEQRKVRTTPGCEYDAATGSWYGMWKEEHEVARTELEVPEGSEDTDSELQIPMLRFKSCLPLPRSLRDCRQTVERDDWIRIKHTVHYSILLHNSDGHISELKAHHGVFIFISPNLPLGEDNVVTGTSNSSSTLDSSLLNDMVLAPPAYETHHLDQLYQFYEDIDPAGFLTPGTRNLSRRPSVEHLNDQAARDHSRYNQSNDLAHSLALSHRLMNLEAQDEGEDTETTRRGSGGSLDLSREQDPVSSQYQGVRSAQQGYFDPLDGCRSGCYRAPMIPHDSGVRQQALYDMGALERMPSYGTAVRTPIRTTIDSRPPTYDLAMSQPPSPT